MSEQTPKPEDKELTIEDVRNMVPYEKRNTIQPKHVEMLNKMMSDPDEREMYRDRFLFNASVMKEGRYTFTQYMEAIKFVSLKHMGESTVSAYAKVFPDRYARLVAEGKDPQRFAINYTRNSLVKEITDREFVPVHLANHDIFQKAVNGLADMMINGTKEKNRLDAMIAIVNHLKPPEKKDTIINVGVVNNQLNELTVNLSNLAAAQLEAIKSGKVTVKELAESSIYTVEEEDEG